MPPGRIQAQVGNHGQPGSHIQGKDHVQGRGDGRGDYEYHPQVENHPQQTSKQESHSWRVNLLKGVAKSIVSSAAKEVVKDSTGMIDSSIGSAFTSLGSQRDS